MVAMLCAADPPAADLVALAMHEMHELNIGQISERTSRSSDYCKAQANGRNWPTGDSGRPPKQPLVSADCSIAPAVTARRVGMLAAIGVRRQKDVRDLSTVRSVAAVTLILLNSTL
jgi:hypothetical protein